MRKYSSAFIAFSDDGKMKANSVYKALQSLGLSKHAIYHYQFSAKDKVSDIGASIRAKIRDRDALILVYSAQARKSEWVQHEVSVASGLEKPVIIIKNAHNVTIRLHDSVKNYEHLIKISGLYHLSQYFDGDSIRPPKSQVESLP